MRFQDFAKAHGLLVDAVDFGKWIRCPTEGHPNKKNGSLKHLGNVAFLQNHETMTEPVVWFPEESEVLKIDLGKIKKAREAANRKLLADRAKAARKARDILSMCSMEQHAYLDAKGFRETLGLVYRPSEGRNALCIPMYVASDLVGLQMIERDGEKKFLFGQRCSSAEHLIGTKGAEIHVEGYATGLSVSTCLAALKVAARVRVWFSAGNMQANAKTGFVVADNDKSGTGLRAAKATGLPYYMSEVEGEDFNDLHKRLGTFKASQILRKAMQTGPP